MTEPTPVRKKPVAVEAMEWPGGAEAATPIIDWVLSHGGTARYLEDDNAHYERIRVDTIEGTMTASAGWWIIRGTKGEFYPCRPDIFAENFEVIEPETSRSRRARASAERLFFTAAGGQPPTDEQKATVAELRELVVALGAKIIESVPAGRNRDLAIDALEDVQMRANRAIFEGGKLGGGSGGGFVSIDFGAPDSASIVAQRFGDPIRFIEGNIS